MTEPTLAEARQLLAKYGDATWLLADPHHSVANKAGPAIYICDVQSGRVLLLETNRGALRTLTEQVEFDEAGFQLLRRALNPLIHDLLDSRTGIHPDTRRGVILGAALCITETRGFHITKHHDADVQYLLMRYLDESSRQYVLTPMPLFKPHPIAAAQLNSAITHMLLTEQLSHPDHFSHERQVLFKETQRHVLSGQSA